jgi:N-acetylglucosamine kinase-like BadF-type ATPase
MSISSLARPGSPDPGQKRGFDNPLRAIVGPLSIVLGIDAGATKTFALVADEDGHILGFGQGGPGNHQVAGLEPALAEVRRSSEEALAQAGASSPVDFGFLGLAGADLPVDFALLTPAVEPASSAVGVWP